MISGIYRSEKDTKKWQIDTLRIFNSNVIEVQEGQEYKINFKSGKNDLGLHIILPGKFPQDKPILRINPIVVHDYVDNDGEICNAPGLRNYSAETSDLGRVVRAIISEFEKNPPCLAADSCTLSTSPSLSNMENNSFGVTNSPKYFPISHSYSTNAQPVCHSKYFPQLNSMCVEDLQNLLSHMELQQEIIDNSVQSQQNNKIIDELIEQIGEFAESNLQKEPQLDELKKDINVRIEEIKKCAFETERLNHLYQSMADKYSPTNIKNAVLEAAEEANESCEQIAEAFLEGRIDVDKFAAEFIQKKSLAQARKTKAEKFAQQLKDLERAGF